MNVENLSSIVLAVSAAASAFIVPGLLDRRRDKREERERAEARAKELEENSDVSWVNINKAIVAERDNLQKRLDAQNLGHIEEIAQMRERHATEIKSLRDKWERDSAEMRRGLDAEASEMKQRYDEQISQLSTRLAECQNTVSSLYRELYELQQRPPRTP